MAEDRQSLIVPEVRRAAQVTDWYARSRLARPIVASIPMFGGTLDLILSGGASERRERRIDEFIEALDARLRGLDVRLNAVADPDQLVDLTQTVLVRVANTRTADKRRRFANILVHQAMVAAPIDQAEAAADLLEALSDLDMRVMAFALSKPHQVLDNGVAVVCLPRRRNPRTTGDERHLTDDFPGVPPEQLSWACAKLVAMGLFIDEGLNRYDIGALELLTTTDLARWLSAWINDEQTP